MIAKCRPFVKGGIVYERLRQYENEIGRGGVYGATAAIFRKGNLISRKKNRFLAFFSCAL
jgi:hypothetical protein